MNGHTEILGERINSNSQKLIDFTDENSFEILNHILSESRGVTSFNEKYELALGCIPRVLNTPNDCNGRWRA